jgi:hypothetical protein
MGENMLKTKKYAILLGEKGFFFFFIKVPTDPIQVGGQWSIRNLKGKTLSGIIAK